MIIIKNKKKSLTILLITIFCLMPVLVYADPVINQHDPKPISVYVNSHLIQSESVFSLNHILIPTREVFEQLGAHVEWRSAEKKIYIELNETLIVLDLNSTEAWVNGEIKTLDVSPQIVNNRVMVPIRFVSENLGFNVEYINSERTVYISSDMSSIEDSKEYETDPLTFFDFNNQLSCLQYDSSTKSLVLNDDIDLNNISVDDLYLKHKIIFTLTNIDSSKFQEGTWQGTLDYLKSISIVKNASAIQITVETNTICATTINKDNGKVLIRFMKPKEKYDKIIVLDAGHGGDDPGTSYNQILEKDLTLSYSKALYDKLSEDANIKVYATRLEDTYATEGDGIIGEQYPPLNMRVNLSNEIEPDLYISIHVNWSDIDLANGIDTYYYPLGTDTKGQDFAKTVQDALVSQFNMKNRGAKTSDFYVLKYTNAPAILIETGFISNALERDLLTSTDYPTRFAETLYQCILDYYY